MENSAADSFRERDFVFAQAPGYVPWPGILTRKDLRTGMVLFMCTNETKSIPYQKIWRYDDRSKEQFITSQNMEYEEFREAICIAEKLRSGDVDVNCDGAGWQLVSLPDVLAPTIINQNRKDWQLNYVRQVRLERESLSAEVKFIHVINVLRGSLRLRKQDYPSALCAFQQLQGLVLSELLLVRNFGAVEAVHHLCRFASEQPQDQKEAKKVKSLANKLMERFELHFKPPFNSPDFWSEYCLRSKIYRSYTVDVDQVISQLESEQKAAVK
ncbi:uncharacterized protein LOC108039576 [Drosophila rhopaloa]|uniref:Uncharacterized protein LOC108039576 n=1 Tax=Drosophila rhopaloa TaxID=1041015 RepID=A0A6P4E2H1_DRORH|nr:uncharacterized protein LOC108039576 [Drosophila rhopaloa]